MSEKGWRERVVLCSFSRGIVTPEARTEEQIAREERERIARKKKKRAAEGKDSQNPPKSKSWETLHREMGYL